MKAKTIIALIPILGICACANVKKESKPKDPVKVTVSEVTPQATESKLNYVGTVKASKNVTIFPKYPGTVLSVKVTQGSIVKVGDPIAEISSESVKTTLETSKATYDYAKDAYERILEVREKGAVPEQKFNEIQSQYLKAKSAYEAAQTALDDCTIKAPYGGVIGDIFINEGESASIVEPVAKLYDLKSIEVEISVPESEISSIHKGQNFILKVPALGGKSFAAKVQGIGMEASPISHSYPCTLAVESGSELRPGMVCKAALVLDGELSIVVPADAVHTDTEGRYVWTVENDIVRKVRVQTAGFSGKGVIVSEGLYGGELLVTEGAHKISSGMKVSR